MSKVQRYRRSLRELSEWEPLLRVREAVAIGLQYWGERDMEAFLAAMAEWSRGDYLETRAAVAAVC